MYLFRDGSIVLALCSTLSAAVPIAQSNPREFSSEQLDRTNNNRRVKYAQANDGGPNLISPEGGLVLAGTGLGAHLWTKAAANKRHKIQTEQLKLDHQKQTELVEQEMQAKGDRRVEWARKSTAQQHCYGPEMDKQEKALSRSLTEGEKRGIWEDCLRKNVIPHDPDWVWGSARPTMLEALHRAEKNAAKPRGVRNDFSLANVEKATQPFIAEMDRSVKQAGAAFQQNAPAMLSTAARRVPAAAMKVAAVP